MFSLPSFAYRAPRTNPGDLISILQNHRDRRQTLFRTTPTSVPAHFYSVAFPAAITRRRPSWVFSGKFRGRDPEDVQHQREKRKKEKHPRWTFAPLRDPPHHDQTTPHTSPTPLPPSLSLTTRRPIPAPKHHCPRLHRPQLTATRPSPANSSPSSSWPSSSAAWASWATTST